MGEATIYRALRAGGLTRAGALAVMGNMYCESALRSDNVQDNCPMGDNDYTLNVNFGGISRDAFSHDAYGYGLCQWTYYTRKAELYDLAKSTGVSISDEKMQVAFCLSEMRRDYPGLLQFLQTTGDMATAVERVCKEYERPAVNNISERYAAAVRFANMPLDSDVGECTGDSCPIDLPTVNLQQNITEDTPTDKVNVRVLQYGHKGRDVFLLQCGLQDIGIDCGIPDGEFFSKTRRAVQELQRNCDLEPTGIADGDVWQILFQ